MRRRIVQIWVLLAAVGWLPLAGRTATVEEWFRAGNAFYEDREYDSAIVAYRRILDQGWESATVYFNLGNAYFRSGDLGRAVLYYLRAQRLSPGDDDIATNLAFARRFTSIQMEGVELNPISSMMRRLVAPWTLTALAWWASACFIVLLFLLALRFGFDVRRSWLRGLTAVWLVVVLVAFTLTTYKYQIDYLKPRAVLVADEVPVYSGPTEQSELELMGASGLIVEILKESGDFYNVQFENSRRGWIRKDAVMVV